MFTESELNDVVDAALAELSAVPDEQLARARRWRSGTPGAPADPGVAAVQAIDVGDPAAALLRFKRGERGAAMDWAKEFVLRFVGEIRSRICATGDGTTANEAVGVTAKGAATALAAWLAGAFAISNPLAIGIAALVLMVVGGSLKGAFCGMSDRDLAKQLRRA